MPPAVIAFEGPVGVGKSTLGEAVAERLQFGFVDGDEFSEPGPWFGSILRTSRRIVANCALQLHCSSAVIVAYPMRCKDWFFFRETLQRRGIAFFCVSLTADVEHIITRERVLTQSEIERSSQMIKQGYGQRPFSDLAVRTDEDDFVGTCDHLTSEVAALLERRFS